MMQSHNGGNNHNQQNHQTFAGYDDNTKSAKKLGANAPGEYGGIYHSADGEDISIFKRDTMENGQVRYQKVIAEFVAGRLIAAMMEELHPEQPDYTDKLVAKVVLATANPDDNILHDNDDLIYLQSIFLKNYGGDFWEWAFSRKPRAEIISQFKIDIAQRQRASHPEMTDAEIEHYVDATAVDLEDLFNKIARRTISAKHPKGKPKAVLAALLKNFSADAISIPSNALLENPTLLADFCDQATARILVSDYGIHPGNFGIIPVNGEERLASLDYGAGLQNLFPAAAIFSRSKKDTGTKFYKNHLLEYDPRVIKSPQMAHSLIHLGKLSDDFFVRQANAILTAANIPYSPDPIRQFCKHLGMDSHLYSDKNTSDELLVAAKNFLAQRLAARRNSMVNQGYGLLYEHCINHRGELVPEKIAAAKQKYPGFSAFIANDLQSYQFVLHPSHSAALKSKVMRGYTLSIPSPPSTHEAIEQDISNKIEALKKSILPTDSKDKLIEDIQSKIDVAVSSTMGPMTVELTEHTNRLQNAITQIRLITEHPSPESFLKILDTQVFTGNNSFNQARNAALAFIKDTPESIQIDSGTHQLPTQNAEATLFIGTHFQPKPHKPAQLPVALVQTTNDQKTFTSQTAFTPRGGIKQLDSLPYFTRDRIAKIKEQMRFACNLVETTMATIKTNGPITISDWGPNLSRAVAVYCHYMGYELSPKQYSDKITKDQMIRLIGDFQNQIEEDPALKAYIEEAKARRDLKLSHAVAHRIIPE